MPRRARMTSRPTVGSRARSSDGGGLALALTDDVHAEVQAHGEVDVEASGRAEHDGVTWRAAAKGVAGGVVVAIGLDFDHAPADPTVQEGAAQQVVGDLDDRTREEGAGQGLAHADAGCMAMRQGARR